MTDYTTPVSTTFEMQRAAIEQSQQAFEQSVEFQQNVGQAFLDSLDTQESAQRRGVELSQQAIHSYLDAVENTVPGVAGTVEEVRNAVDEQFEFLLENHAEVFESLGTELDEGIDAYDDLTGDYVAAVEEQIEMVLDAHEDLEGQSVEAVEQVEEQMDQLQDQVEQVQDQVQEVQEQAQEQLEA